MSASTINHFIEIFLPLNISCFDEDVKRGVGRMSEQRGFYYSLMAGLQLSGSTTGGGAAFFSHNAWSYNRLKSTELCRNATVAAAY